MNRYIWLQSKIKVHFSVMSTNMVGYKDFSFLFICCNAFETVNTPVNTVYCMLYIGAGVATGFYFETQSTCVTLWDSLHRKDWLHLAMAFDNLEQT